MALNDPLSNALSNILNAERVGKSECRIYPVNKIIKKILDLMKDNGYIGAYKERKDTKGDSITINLLGRINKCGVIKPRYAITKNGFEKFEKRYLPAKEFGIIIVSTSKGIMIHSQAKEKNIGGRLIAYCY